jgi:hypothetical protein
MNRHTFLLEQSYDNQPATTHEVTTDAETISDILDAFVLYLRGCGFSVEDGEITYADRRERDDLDR